MSTTPTFIPVDYKKLNTCCPIFFKIINKEDSPIWYDEANNYFFFHIHYSKQALLLRHCPWCQQSILDEINHEYHESLTIDYSLPAEAGFVEYNRLHLPTILQNDKKWIEVGLLQDPADFDHWDKKDSDPWNIQPNLPRTYPRKNKPPYDPACCPIMTKAMGTHTIPIKYQPVFKHYTMRYDYSTSSVLIASCPWCNRVFPPSLFNRYRTLVKKELKLDTFTMNELYDYISSFPEEWRTDLWWKKRNL